MGDRNRRTLNEAVADEAWVSARAKRAVRDWTTQVVDELREEWDELGLMSYHGAPWNELVMLADLTPKDIEQIRELLRDAASAIEALR